MAFFACNSSSCSSNSQEFYHLINPNFLDDDDDDDTLLLHPQQHHRHHNQSVDEMMMVLNNCLSGGHTAHASAADDPGNSLVLQGGGGGGGGEVALPVDGDNKSPKLPAPEIPQEEKKRNYKDVSLIMEMKSTKKICRRRNNRVADGAVKASNEEAPPSFVHVRARRGQATDSHSLAERVRREKISVRMKMLQNLVPECEKMIGKANVLDAIIRYVKSLQNQVEFLSMKIAYMSSILEACGLHFDDSMNLQAAAHQHHRMSLSLEEEVMWKMGGRTPIMFQHPKGSNNYEMMEQASSSSATLQLPLLFLPSQLGPTYISQDGSSCCCAVQQQVSEQDQGNCLQ